MDVNAVQTPDAASGKTHAQVTGPGSAWSRYGHVMVGKAGLGALLYYEWCTALATVPGALGLMLRKTFWPHQFAACGAGSQFSERIRCMHPGRIWIGARAVIADGCVLDARCHTTERAIELGDAAMLSHGVMLSAKNDTIRVGQHCGIGAYTVIQATAGNPVEIGDDVVIGAHCYITGGGNYHTERLDIPIARQGLKVQGGITIGPGVWIGAQASLLGGITIGRDSIIGTGAVVTKSIPERSIAVGVPARVVDTRR